MAAFCYNYQICFSVLVGSSAAVVDALKTLQQKIKRLELERKQAEKSYRQFSHDARNNEQVTASYTVPSQPAASLSETDNSGRKGKWWRMQRERPLLFSQALWKVFSVDVFFNSCVLFMITELDCKLQSAEARCKVLEKQLDYMRKMVENAKKERNVLMENQVVQKATKQNY